MKKYIPNRNFLLVLAVIMGISFPKYASLLKPYAFWILAVVMVASLTGISNKALRHVNKLLNAMLAGIILNHVIFGIFIIIAAYLFSFDINLFYGFIIIAATPPGVAIIPFTDKLKGDVEYSIIATFGAFLASILISPLLIKAFSGNASVSYLHILRSMVTLILIPFIISRAFLYKKIINTVKKHRGRLIDIGFALIIYTSVGINSSVFYQNFLLLFKIVAAFGIIMFLGSWLLSIVLENKVTKERNVSNKLIFAIKSSGFAVVTSIEIFGDKASVPATVMSVMVLVFLLVQIYLKKIITLR